MITILPVLERDSNRNHRTARKPSHKGRARPAPHRGRSRTSTTTTERHPHRPTTRATPRPYRTGAGRVTHNCKFYQRRDVPPPGSQAAGRDPHRQILPEIYGFYLPSELADRANTSQHAASAIGTRGNSEPRSAALKSLIISYRLVFLAIRRLNKEVYGFGFHY